jgi:hypothetical protein
LVKYKLCKHITKMKIVIAWCTCEHILSSDVMIKLVLMFASVGVSSYWFVGKENTNRH